MMQAFGRRRGLGKWLVALAASLLVLALFPGEVLRPNAYLNGSGGDAIRNYYALMYYARYDAGHRFTGMNYPRGEHLNFLDLQPLLAVPLAWGRQLGLPTASWAAGATNLGLLLALVVAAVVLYAVLRRLALPGWFAGLAALLLTFMCPQLDRFQGHMSLGYACIVPIQWYGLVRILEAPGRRRWYWLLGTFNLLVGGLAGYHLAIGSYLVALLLPVLLWQQGWAASRALLGRLALTAALPMLAFAGWLRLTDHVADRPRNPYGLWVYHANFRSVFGPGRKPLAHLWETLFHTDSPIWEGQVYVGVLGLVVLLCTVVLVARYLWRGQWRRVLRPVLPQGLRAPLWAATLLLLVAMMPLRLPGLHGLVEVLGPLKQFRSLGRFAWPFYYIYGGYAAFYLYRGWRYWRQHRRPVLAAAWLLPLLALWGAEAAWYVHPIAESIAQRQLAAGFSGEEGNYRQLLGWTSYRPDDFQAILPLPYYAVGTDKIALNGSDRSTYQSYKASLNLHLPLLAGAMGRSSVGETLGLTQLLSSPLVPKQVLARLPSAKPLLLLVTPDGLTPAEQRLVSLGERIASSDDVTLYALPVAALAATSLPAARQRATALLPTLASRGGLYATTGKGVLYRDFATSPDRRGRLASGAFHELKEGFSVLYAGLLPTPADTGRYEASVWVNAQTAYGVGSLHVLQFRGDERVADQVAGAGSSTEILGDWLRVAVVFRPVPGATRLEIQYESQDLLADDLLLRPLDTDVYWHDARGQLVLNGYPLGQ